MRRRLLAVAMLLAICLSTAGLFSINAANAQRARPREANNVIQFSSDPNKRMREMLNENEQSGQIREDWRRFWMLDQPSHLTPVRIHGRVGP